METNRRRHAGFALALAAALAAAGCGDAGSPTAPALAPGGGTTEPAYTRENPPPFLTASRSPSLIAATLRPVTEWLVVVSTWVEAGTDRIVTGSRYKLRFFPGSLEGGAQVTVQEQHPDRIEFELGPHGRHFAEPVELVIDFSGTNADTTCDKWDGSGPPDLYGFDEASGTWVKVPSKVSGTKVLAELEHFSTYGLARGKSGW